MKALKILILLFSCVPLILRGQQQVPFLERTITITLDNERIDLALKKIGEQAGFTFSYNPSILESNKTVSYAFKQKTIREILDQLFSGTIDYKIRANHVILTKAKETSKEDEKILTGYVVDEATGERLKNVSIYDPVTLTSTVTDSYGYFEMKVDKPSSSMKLIVNKQNYSDTIVAVSSGKGRLLNIPIKIDKQKWITAADSVQEKFKRFWNKTFIHPKRPNFINIRDTIHRPVQLSVVPFLGTNHLLSGNVVNDYSFNILGGYSRGLEKFELGGFFNIEREDMNGGQIAGVFNAVAGKMKGAQFAGIFNANYDSASGAQVAGISNINWNSSSMFSVAGMLNFTRLDSRGLHLAGLTNFTLGEQQGPHIAGLFNFSTKNSGIVQGAGVFNFAAGSYDGLQIAGLFNFAGRNVRGTQLAGLLNVTGSKVTGSQVAGLLNYATRVNGGQLAVINIADSVKGIPVGIFSFVLKGYHKIEISADEIFYANAAFRTGVRQFYNIFTAGAKPDSFGKDQTYWTFGYGFGSAPKLTKWLSLNLDVTANQVVYDKKIDALNLLNKGYLGVDLQFTKHVSLTFGGTFNAYVTENNYEGYKPLFTNYNPHIIHNKTYSDVNIKTWLGGKIGLRFL
jgi:hypothetical protein